MPVNLHATNEELDGIETETLIDMLAECTAKYTRLLLTDPNGEEFIVARDEIQRIQEALNRRAHFGGSNSHEPGRA